MEAAYSAPFWVGLGLGGWDEKLSSQKQNKYLPYQ